MLLAFGIILLIGLAIGGEYLLRGKEVGFKRCILSLSFAKRLAIELAAAILLFSAVNYDYFAILNMTWYKLIVFAGISLIVVTVSVCLSLLKGKKDGEKILLMAIICLICVISAEALVFNSRAIESHEYTPLDLVKFGKITASGTNEDGSYHIGKGKSAKFEAQELLLDFQNLFLDISVVNAQGEEIPYTVKIEATDQANELYITSMPNRKIYPESSSQYVPMQLRGKTDKIRLTITPDGSVEANMTVRSIAVNTPKPFVFDMGRVVFLFAAALLLCLMAPGSPAHKMKLGDTKWQIATTAAVAGLEILMIFLIISSSSHYLQLLAKHQAQYQELAQSFLNGHLYLEEEVPQFLLEMENPYDYALRRAQGQAYYWDAALYDGHYYVYFGVIPCLLTYLPYYVLTGESLPNDIALFIFAIIFIIGCFAFVKQVIKRYFPNIGISYVSYLVISLLIVNGSGLLFMASYADMYSVPIMAALAFTACGLALWLSALNCKALRIPKLILGSLCMALVSGCRPNLLLFSALAIPFFAGEIILAYKEKRMFKTSSVMNALAFALPYFIVAAGMMWYNYSRFGSPFDFGANYNLTTNDMTSRGFVWDRMFPAVYSYLLQFPKMTATYPFIRYADFDSTYMGVTIRESTYGGIFAISPLLLLIFLIPFVKKVLKGCKVYAPVLILTAIGIITPLLDAQFAGILQRYFADFSLMLYMSAALILLAIINHFKSDKIRYAIRAGILVCAVAMVVYQGALVLRVVDIAKAIPHMFWY